MELPLLRRELSFYSTALALLCISLCYWTALTVYRLYLHPLRKFPGPKLAAASRWFEFYHDIVHKGCFIWKIQELHERYGRT
jgi:hypothetical protein